MSPYEKGDSVVESEGTSSGIKKDTQGYFLMLYQGHIG